MIAAVYPASCYQDLLFIAAISRKSAKRIRQEINGWPWRYWRQKELTDIRKYCQSLLRGWLTYYGLFGKSIIRNVMFHFVQTLSPDGVILGAVAL
jgi:RNA-directed DNA polymerase